MVLFFEPISRNVNKDSRLKNYENDKDLKSSPRESLRTRTTTNIPDNKTMMMLMSRNQVVTAGKQPEILIPSQKQQRVASGCLSVRVCVCVCVRRQQLYIYGDDCFPSEFAPPRQQQGQHDSALRTRKHQSSPTNQLRGVSK